VRPALRRLLGDEAGGRASFRRLFAACDVESLALDAAVRHSLRDWDTPEQVAADCAGARPSRAERRAVDE